MPPSHKSPEELSQEFLDNLDVSSGTLREYRMALDYFCQHFSSMEQVTRYEAKQFLIIMSERYALKSLGKMQAAWTGLLDHAGLDPAIFRHHRIKPAKKGFGSFMPWSDEEYLQLLKLAHKDPALQAGIMLGAYTGSSTQGISRCQMVMKDDIACLHLPETKTTNRERMIPMAPMVMCAYSNWDKERLGEHVLSKRFTKVKQKISMDRRKAFHSFRVSVATKLENAGIDERIAARWLGHSIHASLSYGLYSQGLRPENLMPCIDAIQWPIP